MQERLDGLPAAYAHLADALGARGVASSGVYLAECFDSTHDEKGNFCNPLIDTPAPFDFDQSEAEYAYRRILLPLNSGVATAAKKHTWNFVSGAPKLFLRHGYCSNASWIVGLVESTLSQANRNGTLHSTTFGNTKQAPITSLKIRADFCKNGRTRRPRR